MRLEQIVERYDAQLVEQQLEFEVTEEQRQDYEAGVQLAFIVFHHLTLGRQSALSFDSQRHIFAPIDMGLHEVDSEGAMRQFVIQPSINLDEDNIALDVFIPAVWPLEVSDEGHHFPLTSYNSRLVGGERLEAGRMASRATIKNVGEFLGLLVDASLKSQVTGLLGLPS